MSPTPSIGPRTAPALTGILLAIALACPRALGQSEPPTRSPDSLRSSISAAIDEIQRLQDRSRSIDQTFRENDANYHEATWRAEEKLDELDSECHDELNAMRTEKELAREEYRRGLFCSECDRTKSRIEREERTTFRQHLIDVRGRAVPKSEGEIAEKMAEYDRTINALEERCEKRRTAIEDSLVDRQNELIARDIELRLLKQRLRRQVLDARDRLRRLQREYHDAARQWDTRWKVEWAGRLKDALTDTARERVALEIKLRAAEDRLRRAILRDEPTDVELFKAVDELEQRLDELKRAEARRVRTLRDAYDDAYRSLDRTRYDAERALAGRLRNIDRPFFATGLRVDRDLLVGLGYRPPPPATPSQGGSSPPRAGVPALASPHDPWATTRRDRSLPGLEAIGSRTTRSGGRANAFTSPAFEPARESQPLRFQIRRRFTSAAKGTIDQFATEAVTGRAYTDPGKGFLRRLLPSISFQTASNFLVDGLFTKARQSVARQSEDLYDYYDKSYRIDVSDLLRRWFSSPAEALDFRFINRPFEDNRPLKDGEIPP